MTGKTTMWLSRCAFIPLIVTDTACNFRIGNGHLVTEPREVTGFSAVRNESHIDVHIREAAETTVSVTVDENLLDTVVVNVVDGTLVIDTIPANSVLFSEGCHVEVRLPYIESAESDGVGGVSLLDIAASDTLTLAAGDIGKLDYVGTVPNLHVALDGIGGATLKGTADFLSIDVGGIGGVNARDLLATSADIRDTGSGSVYAQLEGGTLKIRLTGTGNVEWWGEATVLESTDTGTGSILHH